MARTLLIAALAACVAAARAASPAEPAALPRISGSGPFLIVQPDGGLQIFGDLDDLPHGDGTPTRRATRIKPKPVAGVAGAVDAAGTSEHAVVALADGRVMGWGEPCAATGQDGDTPLLLASPAPGLAGVVQVATGGHFGAARTADGSAWAWGRRSVTNAGLLGTGFGCAPPVRLPLAGVVQISAGTAHLLALRRDGTVWAAGDNADGQLGTGSRDEAIGPMRVLGLADVVQVAAMGSRSVALRRDGSLWQWGWELSDKPQRVPLPAGAVTVQAHGGYAVAQLADGTLWAWGEGYGGIYADGSFDKVSARPLKLPLKFRPVAWHALNHAVFAWMADGTLVGWGAHAFTPPGSPRRGHSTVPEPLLRWTAPAQWDSALRTGPGQAQGAAR